MRAVIFLLEDTLVPDQTLERWQWAWRPQGPALSERHVRAAVKRGLHLWDRRRWEAIAGGAGPVDARAYHDFLVQMLAEIAGHPLPEAETEAVVARLPRAPVATPFPEVVGALAAVKRTGLLVAAISERPGPSAAETLKRSGLQPHVDRVLGARPEAPWLPAKEAFRAAAMELGLKPAEIAVVGRLYWSDVRAAARAGHPAVLVDRADWWPRVAERRIVSLTDLPAALAEPERPIEKAPAELGPDAGPVGPSASPGDRPE